MGSLGKSVCFCELLNVEYICDARTNQNSQNREKATKNALSNVIFRFSVEPGLQAFGCFAHPAKPRIADEMPQLTNPRCPGVVPGLACDSPQRANRCRHNSTTHGQFQVVSVLGKQSFCSMHNWILLARILRRIKTFSNDPIFTTIMHSMAK